MAKRKGKYHPARKYYFAENLKNYPKKELIEYLNTEVFTRESFKNHIIEVSHNLKIDEYIVEQAIKSFIVNISITMNTVRKVKTKINVYAFFSFIIQKGKRV